MKRLLLPLLAIPFLLPLLWMLSTAFKPAAQVYAAPPTWLPDPPTLENFSRAWGLLDFPRFFVNSLIVSGLTALGAAGSSALAGYAFAVLEGRGKRLLFALLLTSMALPASAILIPQFMLFSALGWVNTWLPLIVPAFFGAPFYVFLFRQYFRRLPAELWDSAALDGCNPWQAFLLIGLPLARPALAAAAVFAFIGAWNDFLNPLVYLSKTETFTLNLGLSLFDGLFYTQLEYLMPMSLLALLPALGFYALSQKYLLDGVINAYAG